MDLIQSVDDFNGIKTDLFWERKNSAFETELRQLSPESSPPAGSENFGLANPHNM